MSEATHLLNLLNDLITSTNSEFTIENWKSFELDFSRDFQERKSIRTKIAEEVGNAEGFYAIFDEKCLYIGIGRPIKNRIKSHYYASQEKDTAEKWVNFFKQYKKTLTIYWKEFSPMNHPNTDDAIRIYIEAVLTQKYIPEFVTHF
jgi:hypothetical protein